MMKEIYLAGGCFWGVEHYFSLVEGITKTSAGYANGKGDATYEKLKETDHAEAVKLTYDDNIITLNDILDLYFQIIDPVSLNKQGEDVGRQYRTGIYYTDLNDYQIIDIKMKELEDKIGQESKVEVMVLENYFDAEERHQDYLNKNPNGYCHLGSDHFDRAKNYKK